MAPETAGTWAGLPWRHSTVWLLFFLLAVAGCASAKASAWNTATAAFNQRLVTLQQNYRAAMVDLEYLNRLRGS